MPKTLAPLAFVDIETTGSNSQRDRITEIAVITWDHETLTRWERLINPGVDIPEFIQRLTGISPEMLEGAPAFDELASELWRELEGKIFVAHNANFDYSFIKAAFKRLDMEFKSPMVCTVKLSRQLFPLQARHNLDTLIETHGLVIHHRHRAMGDADVLWQFWQVCERQFGADLLVQKVFEQTKKASLPPHIDQSVIDAMPDTHGVYTFYGDGQLPLYIGKSNTLRTRVLSHFQGSKSKAKEMKIALQVKHIDWRVTSGELGALILESKLIKEQLPSFNVKLRRTRELCAWTLKPDDKGYLRAHMLRESELDVGRQEHLYGLFASQRMAKNALKSLCQQHSLCEGLMGLERLGPSQPCFAHQLKRCQGACVGLESANLYNLRLTTALGAMKVKTWPYAGAIGIQEGDVLHVVDHWFYYGCAKSADDVGSLLSQARPDFDLDIYKILQSHLKKVSRAQIFNLEKEFEAH
jgi:DNA polymerase-3 subunit epsilon